MKLSVLISVLVSLSFIQPLSAQDFEAGMRAYRIKNYTTAIREWTPLARAGDAQAQNSLGFMYEAGRGVNSPLKKALLTGFHSTAKHNATKAVSPSSETMRTI